MLPILFKIGPVTIYSWGFFLVLAYLAATFILWREGKRQGYNEERLLDLSIISLIASLVGGRALFVILNIPLFQEEPISALYFWQGGFVYQGAFLVVLVASIYFIRRWKWSFFQIADIASLAATAALVLGKIGAFLAGLDFGKESGLPWAVSFPGLVGARHPAQLYEVGSFFLIFVLLYAVYFRNIGSANMKSGKIFFYFLILSNITKGLLEFYRADYAHLDSYPIVSIVSFIIAIFATLALYYFQIRDVKNDVRVLLRAVFWFNKGALRRIRF
jgi:phosphatidylglycerol:prolipoprotein diacylglycerol transferase